MNTNQSGYRLTMPGRLLVIACLVLLLAAGMTGAAGAATPTPTAVPTASPTPAYGTSYLEMSDCIGMSIAHTRSSSASGWNWYVVPAEYVYTRSLGRVADSANAYFDQAEYTSAPIAIRLQPGSSAISITNGDYCTVAWNSGTTRIYPPALTSLSIATYYYVASNGATYTDRWLQHLAKGIPTPTAVTTATATPTPTRTPTPTATPTANPTASPVKTATPEFPTPTPSPSPAGASGEFRGLVADGTYELITYVTGRIVSQVQTPTPSPSPSNTPTPSPSPTLTPSPTPSPSPTPTASLATPTPEPSATEVPGTPTPSPTTTPTPSPSPTATPSPSPTPTVVPSPTAASFFFVGAGNDKADGVYCPQTTFNGCRIYSNRNDADFWMLYNGVDTWQLKDVALGYINYVLIGDCTTDLTSTWTAVTRAPAPAVAAFPCGPTPSPSPSPSPA